MSQALLARPAAPRFAAGAFGRPRPPARLAAPPPAAAAAVQELRRRGAIVKLALEHPEAVARGMRERGQEPIKPVVLDAMLDTGASISAIDRSLAARLGLVQVGSVPISGVTGVQEQPVFTARLTFDRPAATFDPVRLTGAAIGVQQFHVLVGRDVMERMVLVYDGPEGVFQLSGPGGAPSLAPSAGWLPKSLGVLTTVAAVVTVAGIALKLIRIVAPRRPQAPAPRPKEA